MPQAVVINLGTNDWHGCSWPGGQPVPSSTWHFVQQFTASYLQLVETIASVYGKGTQIFLGVGPMTTNYQLPVQWVVGNATAQGLHVHFLNQTGFAHGDCGHPSYQTGMVALEY